MTGPPPVPKKRSEPRILERYVLYDEIAAGGMATVHVGRLVGAVGFSRTVAIKRLHPQYAKDPEFVSMLLDEARLAARVQHPNVVSTLDVVAKKGELFIVMEYVDGEAFSRLIKASLQRGRPVPPRVASAVVTQALLGLHAAHEATSEHGEPLGVVHRDVSPQNILVGADGVARVIDFGVAKAASRVQTTSDGQIKGKIAYMSPEQLRSEPVDRRSDVFACGVVLWEALTGRRLFATDNPAGAVAAILTGSTPPPGEFVDGLPAALDAVVGKALARERNDRHATAREMALALERALPPAGSLEVGDWVAETAAERLKLRAERVAEIESQSNVSVDDDVHAAIAAAGLSEPPPAPGPAASASLASGVTTLSQVSSTTETSVRRRWWIAALGIVALGVVVAVLGVSLSRRDPPPRPATGSVSVSHVETVAPSASERPPSLLQPAASATTTRPAAAAAGAATWSRTPAAPRAGKPAGKKAGCDPPYVVGADGVRRFKPECF